MGSADYPENSRENRGIFPETDDVEDIPLSVLADPHVDGDSAARKSETELGFQSRLDVDVDLRLGFPGKQTENNLGGDGGSARDRILLFGLNLLEIEGESHGEAAPAETSTARKRRRIFGFEIPPEYENQGAPVTTPFDEYFEVRHKEAAQNSITQLRAEIEVDHAMCMGVRRGILQRAMRDAAAVYARDVHSEIHGYTDDHDRKKKGKSETEKKVKELEGLFQDAMELIQKRSKSGPDSGQKMFCVEKSISGEHRLNLGTRIAPSLLELSVKGIGANANALVSLENIPDELRTKIAGVVSGLGEVDTRFVQLLSKGSPSEICLKNCANLMEKDLTEILGGCDAKNLTVLQLDLCGQGMTEYVIRDFLAQSPNGFSALTVISLKGAFRLTDHALGLLCRSAPLLQSVNLTQCSLLTSSAISILSDSFDATLRELYLEDCQGINPSDILDKLKKFKCLNVLSVAELESVDDDFIIEFVEACGANLAELLLSRCMEVTDDSIEAIGRYCPKLRALDLSCLNKLTDMSLQYIANSCRSICRVKFCRNHFSDEAVAAFLEVSGSCLNELSLNSVRMVGHNTATSLAMRSKKLLSLDLSWCRKLTDEDIRLILQSCQSLRRIKLFGCTQVMEEFLVGHWKSRVQIIGLKMTPVLDHLEDIGTS